MTLIVRHAFVSGVADDPGAAAAGEVLPSQWDANHVLTGAGGGPSIDTAILYDKAGVIGEDAGLEWHYTPQCLTVGAGAPLTDANGNITLSIKGPTNTDVLAITDGTHSFGFFPSSGLFVLGTVSNDSFGFFQGNNGTTVAMNSPKDFTLDSGLHIGWNVAGAGGGVFSPQDTSFARESAGVVQLFDFTSLTTPTGLHIYKTTDTAAGVPTNYERGVFDWTTTSNVLTIGTQNNGTGSVRNLQFVIGGSNKLDYGVSETASWTMNVGNNSGAFVTDGTHTLEYFIGTANGNIAVEIGSFSNHHLGFYANNANPTLVLQTSGDLNLAQGKIFGFSSGTFGSGLVAADTGVARSAANVVEINNGTAGTGPGVILPRPTTFANLPASPTQGMMASITDGLAGNCGDGSCTTFGTNVTGGTGALKLNLWYNGTHWTLIGK